MAETPIRQSWEEAAETDGATPIAEKATKAQTPNDSTIETNPEELGSNDNNTHTSEQENPTSTSKLHLWL